MNVAHLARAPHRAVARRRRHLIELYLAEKERDQGAGPLLQVDLAGVAGALLGSIRRECLNHMIVFGEADLRRSLGAYAAYYNESRTHRSMNKDAPYYRAIERLGAITSHQILGGLHHQYCRIKFSVHTGIRKAQNAAAKDRGANHRNNMDAYRNPARCLRATGVRQLLQKRRIRFNVDGSDSRPRGVRTEISETENDGKARRRASYRNFN